VLRIFPREKQKVCAWSPSPLAAFTNSPGSYRVLAGFTTSAEVFTIRLKAYSFRDLVLPAFFSSWGSRITLQRFTTAGKSWSEKNQGAHTVANAHNKVMLLHRVKTFFFSLSASLFELPCCTFTKCHAVKRQINRNRRPT
jgi:hypothetical protein